MNHCRIAELVIKKFYAVGQGEVRVRRAQRRQRRQGSVAIHGNSFFDEDGRGARRLQQRKVPPICQERDLPRFGVLNPSHSANVEFRRTFQPASQFLRNFSKFHEGAPQSVVAFVGLSASLAQAKEGSTARQSDYSLKRRGCVAPAAAAAWFPPAMATTSRPGTSGSAARGTKIPSVVEFRSGDVICRPLSSSASKSFGTTPSSVSPSL